MVGLWLIGREQANVVYAVQHQCTSSGAEEQDNYSEVLQGHWCSTSQGEASAICSERGPRCAADCNACGANSPTDANCVWHSSEVPGDAHAQQWGCNITQYAHFYHLDCTCSYPPPPPPPPERGEHYESCGYGTDGCCVSPYVCTSTEVGDICLEEGESPILIDLDSNTASYNLTSVDDGVLFDLNADGVHDRVAWTEANTNVAFVALDRNGNGLIDNGSELFGNNTVMSNGRVAPNGFEALRDLDGNRDRQIDAADSVYAQLLAWIDRNHDGQSDASELRPLSEVGVSAILTDYNESHRVDRHGNEYRYVGRAMVVRNGHSQPRRIFDVYLKLGS